MPFEDVKETAQKIRNELQYEGLGRNRATVSFQRFSMAQMITITIRGNKLSEEHGEDEILKVLTQQIDIADSVGRKHQVHYEGTPSVNFYLKLLVRLDKQEAPAQSVIRGLKEGKTLEEFFHGRSILRGKSKTPKGGIEAPSKVEIVIFMLLVWAFLVGAGVTLLWSIASFEVQRETYFKVQQDRQCLSEKENKHGMASRSRLR